MFTTTPRASGRRISLVMHAAFVCVALVTFSACNSSSGGGGRQAFTVTETTPADGVEDVSPGTSITARFSADLGGPTISSETFKVMTSDGTAIVGEFDLGPRVATFQPHAPLPEAEAITVTLTEQIESVTGVPLEALTFGFTVGVVPPDEEEEPPDEEEEPPEAEPLTLIAMDPAPFARSVALDAAIQIEFSAPVESDSVNVDTIWVSGSAGGRYPVTIEMGTPTGTTVRILSGQDWLPGETISVSVLDGIVPADGAPFSGFTYSFHVATTPESSERREGDRWIAPGTVRELRLGDLNHDSHLDLVYYVEGGSSVEALRGTGDGTFALGGRFEVGQRITSIALEDLDGDGDSDLIVGAPDRAYTYFSSHLGPALIFASGEDYVTRSQVYSITAADIDHRGLLDVVLNTDGGVQVFLGDAGSNAVHNIGGTHLAHTPVRCVDLDLDGQLDLVFGTLGFNLITYHLAGSSAGEFGEAVSLIVSDGPADISVDDFTGDGRPDVLALLSLADPDPSPIVLLPQIGELDFANTSLDIEPLPLQTDERMTLADLEGHGLPGILWIDRASGALSYLPPDTTVTPPWSEKTELHGGPGGGAVQAADLDGDGRLDLAFGVEREIRFLLSSTPSPPPPPPEIDLDLSVDRVDVRQGDEGAFSTVRLTHTVEIQGATILVGYDPLVVRDPTIDITGTTFETVEFTTWEVIEDASALHVTALVDVELPLEGLTLPPAENRALFKVRFDVPADAPLGESVLGIVDEVAAPSLSTGFIVGEEMLAPTTAQGGTVLVQEPLPPPTEEPNQITIETMTAAPGTRVRIPVIANTERELQGFTVVASYDPTALTVESLDLDGSFTQTLSPDFVSPTIRPEEGFFFIGVAFSLLFEGEPRVIPPGEGYILFFIEVEVNPAAVSGRTSITLTDGLNDPPLDNLFTSEGQSFFPRLVSGGVHIEQYGALTFVRGDTNNDAHVDVSDTIFLTGCLFDSRPCPACDDAADVNDDGRLDIADSIYLLNYVFRGGQAPLPPGPLECGVDPTEDDLPCTAVTSCS